MKFRTALIVAVMFIAGPALAQAPATQAPAAKTQPKPAAQHQPGTPAQPAHAAAKKPAAPANPADDKVDPEKQAAIVRLMDLTQESKLGDGVTEFVTNQVRSAMSHTIQADRLPKFMDSFGQKFAASHVPGSVSDAMVHIYARNFSTEDIRGLIKFYESPVGQKAMKALPDVERDSQQAGIEIGRNAAIGILNGMSDEYPELKAMLRPPTPAPAPGAKPEQAPAAASAAPAAKPAPEAAPAAQPAPAPQQ
ncbi:MAG: DUF2059 domain-containing protein [Acidobacteriia bacterium]|nr:DUF2059 domain-containing protein [Terriglobia bacterium]